MDTDPDFSVLIEPDVLKEPGSEVVAELEPEPEPDNTAKPKPEPAVVDEPKSESDRKASCRDFNRSPSETCHGASANCEGSSDPEMA